ncbi:hypothetical protein V8C34DRAFT_216271 [Trichoderma compactum]
MMKKPARREQDENEFMPQEFWASATIYPCPCLKNCPASVLLALSPPRLLQPILAKCTCLDARIGTELGRQRPRILRMMWILLALPSLIMVSSIHCCDWYLSLPPSYRELDLEIDRSFDSGGDMLTTAAGFVYSYELTAVQNRIPNARYLFWLRRRTGQGWDFDSCSLAGLSLPIETIPIRFLICLCCVRLPFSRLDRNQMRLAKIINARLCLGTETMKIFLDKPRTGICHE